MRKTIKKVLKIVIAVIGVLVLCLGIFIILNWESAEILMGTEDLSGRPQEIPEIVKPAITLRDKGEADWPCWRGDNGDARSTVTDIIKDWSSGLKQVWEVNYLCQGRASATWSSPVIQGDRLIVCGRDEGDDLVFCLNAVDGSLLWRNHYAAKAKTNHGTGMRATPYIDENRIYTFGRSGDLVCWDLNEGTILWHKNVEDEGGAEPTWGHSSSPLVSGENVLVQGGGTARVIAYNKLSGEVIWKSGQGDAGYAPTVPITLGDKPAYLAFHGNGLAAVTADMGTELWNTSWETDFGVNATTPLVSGDRIFMTSGYKTGAQLLKVSDTECQILWTTKAIAAHHSDGYILDGFLYGYSGQSYQNDGAFKCLELTSGTVKWSTDEMGWGTCVHVDDHLVCLDINGNLFLMKPHPEKFIKVTELPKALGDVKGPVWTLPVIANGKLYLRFKQRLVCYSLKG
ncbi:MAG: PQQ-like beta-propeller repeat protein [Phycisphaerales bacterium]|nr:MAG: PQQ-like beta-propeller repeat protein [Phycisphaerales bacterium]